ncbi:ABC transporter substrate-binding protein, partial [Rhizobium ruizarguesonis]
EGSADGLSVTFKLRDGVTWHDGNPFTSVYVAFSALNIWKPLQNLGRLVFANLEAVDTPDDYTAIFRFSKPTPFQLIRNALPVVTSVVAKH